MAKLKGVATIELKNVETGEVKTQVEENLVTIAVPEILSRNPFGAVTYPTVAQLLGGIMLFDEPITEDVNNRYLHKVPQAWAGNTVNSSGGEKRGSLNLNASVPNVNGLTFVWEWTTSQANGSYSAISLTNPYTCNLDTFACGKGISRQMTGTVGFKHSDQNGDIIYKIDHEKGMIYAIRAVDRNNLELNIYNRGVYKLHVWQGNTLENTSINNQLVNGVFNKKVMSIPITIENSLFLNENPSSDSNSMGYITSVSYYNGEIYLITVSDVDRTPSAGTKVLITKINDADVHNGNATVAQNILDIASLFGSESSIGSGMSIYCRDQGRNNIKLLSNNIPLVYPYIYVKTRVSGSPDTVAYIKLNINDITDVKVLWTRGQSDITFTREEFSNIKFGDILFVTSANALWEDSNSFAINLKTDEIFPVKGRPFGGWTDRNNGYYELDDNYILAYGAYNTGATSSVFLNPFYLGTINNITPFTKTSAETLTITYTLTEA